MEQFLKIIHAADLHLDSPFEALGSSKAALRRKEQRRLLMDIAELAREKDADMLLLAGDLLDSTSAYAETGAMLNEVFSALDCPVFIAPGNHDYYCAASPYAKELPDNVHIFRRPEKVELPEMNAAVYGAGFSDITSPPLMPMLKADGQDTINICVVHGELGKADSRYAAISPEHIAASGMDYVALGHVHTYSGLLRFGSSFCAYPGCPEGRGFDECGEKGVLYLEVGKGSVNAQFIPLGKRRYMIVEADLSAGDIESYIPADSKDHICRLVLCGEQDEAPDTQAIAKRLSDRFFALQVIDRTSLRRDIWESSSQDSLRGLFLRKMRAMYDGAVSEEERLQVVQALRWGLAALDGGEAVSEI